MQHIESDSQYKTTISLLTEVFITLGETFFNERIH